VFHWERVLDKESGGRGQESGIRLESQLTYARSAAETVRQAMREGRSRWSVILPREPWATPEMLDLGGFYTTALGEPHGTQARRASFRELGSGVQVLGGVGFDARGIIDVRRTNDVTIPVGRVCGRLHFLNAASQAVFIRETVGTYQVTYASGQKAAVTLQNPEDVRPYTYDRHHEVEAAPRPNAPPGVTAALAWSGSARGPGKRNEPVYLTRTTWELPASHQGEVIQSIEVRAGPAASAPLVFAITVE